MNSGVEFLCAMNAFLDNGPGAAGPGSRTVDCHQEGESQLQSSLIPSLSFLSLSSLSCNNITWGGQPIGRYDFGLFWNFITGKQGLLCVTETWRYGYIRDYGDRVETPHGTTIGCEKSSNGLKKRIFLLLPTLLR